MEMTDPTSARARDFKPALPLLWAYDFAIAAFTRESRWRGALLRQLNPRPADVIADLGCGTGSFLRLLGTQAPPARLVGIDPDPRILVRARTKLAAAAVPARLERGYLHDAATLLAASGVNKIVSSLVFHHVPLAGKQAGLAAIFAALPPGGELHIADYGLQRTRLMRGVFAIVQHVDGDGGTRSNAEGKLPFLMRQAGFAQVRETTVIPTVTGSISLYRAVRPQP